VLVTKSKFSRFGIGKRGVESLVIGETNEPDSETVRTIREGSCVVERGGTRVVGIS
jgi:hypothetical protein